MNIIRRLKEHRKHVKKEAVYQETLLSIPESLLRGINTLPVELWSLIIEYTVVQQRAGPRLRYLYLPSTLEKRLVCREFDLCIVWISTNQCQVCSIRRCSTHCTSTLCFPSFLILPSYAR
jgi:hypothetical protein